MFEYDILDKNATLPFGPPIMGVVIRAVYDHEGIVSSLTASEGAGGLDLFLWAREGDNHVTATDTRHHHISKLTANAKAYSKALHTSRFMITYLRPHRKNFLTRRFTGWIVTGKLI